MFGLEWNPVRVACVVHALQTLPLCQSLWSHALAYHDDDEWGGSRVPINFAAGVVCYYAGYFFPMLNVKSRIALPVLLGIFVASEIGRCLSIIVNMWPLFLAFTSISSLCIGVISHTFNSSRLDFNATDRVWICVATLGGGLLMYGVVTALVLHTAGRLGSLFLLVPCMTYSFLLWSGMQSDFRVGKNEKDVTSTQCHDTATSYTFIYLIPYFSGTSNGVRLVNHYCSDKPFFMSEGILAVGFLAFFIAGAWRAPTRHSSNAFILGLLLVILGGDVAEEARCGIFWAVTFAISIVVGLGCASYRPRHRSWWYGLGFAQYASRGPIAVFAFCAIAGPMITVALIETNSHVLKVMQCIGAAVLVLSIFYMAREEWARKMRGASYDVSDDKAQELTPRSSDDESYTPPRYGSTDHSQVHPAGVVSHIVEPIVEPVRPPARHTVVAQLEERQPPLVGPEISPIVYSLDLKTRSVQSESLDDSTSPVLIFGDGVIRGYPTTEAWGAWLDKNRAATTDGWTTAVCGGGATLQQLFANWLLKTKSDGHHSPDTLSKSFTNAFRVAVKDGHHYTACRILCFPQVPPSHSARHQQNPLKNESVIYDAIAADLCQTDTISTAVYIINDFTQGDRTRINQLSARQGTLTVVHYVSNTSSYTEHMDTIRDSIEKGFDVTPVLRRKGALTYFEADTVEHHVIFHKDTDTPSHNELCDKHNADLRTLLAKRFLSNSASPSDDPQFTKTHQVLLEAYLNEHHARLFEDAKGIVGPSGEFRLSYALEDTILQQQCQFDSLSDNITIDKKTPENSKKGTHCTQITITKPLNGCNVNVQRTGDAVTLAVTILSPTRWRILSRSKVHAGAAIASAAPRRLEEDEKKAVWVVDVEPPLN